MGERRRPVGRIEATAERPIDHGPPSYSFLRPPPPGRQSNQKAGGAKGFGGGRSANWKKVRACHELASRVSHRPARTSPTRVSVLSKTVVSRPTFPAAASSANWSRGTRSMAYPCRNTTGAWLTNSIPISRSTVFI